MIKKSHPPLARLLAALPLAVLLCASPAVQADMSIYGQAHVSLDSVDDDNTTVGSENSTLSVTSNKSRLGLRGDERLPEGVRILWQVENTIDLDDGGWGPARDSFLGIRAGFGLLRAGRLVTPYRNASDTLDIFADSRGDYNSVIGTFGGAVVSGQVLFNNRAPNIIVYESPADKRLQFSAAYIANWEGDDLPMTQAEARRDGTSYALRFDSGPLYLSVAGELLAGYGAGGEKAAATKLAGRWQFARGTRVAVIVEEAGTGIMTAGKEEKRAAYYLNLAQVMGNHTLKFAYGRLDELDTTPNSGADFLALGYQRALSRQSEWYVLYARIKNDPAGSYGLHPDHDGGLSAGGIPYAGRDESALSLGLVHRFEAAL